MSVINFFTERYHFKLRFPIRIRRWLLAVAEAEGCSVAELNYIFTSDQRLLAINKEYLNHNTFTDIITFDNSETDQIEGDIFISIPRVRENAKKFDQPFEMELARVLVHGLLHLAGYSDKNRSTKKEMRAKENTYLSLLRI
jgi:probable rRNA maturation factor